MNKTLDFDKEEERMKRVKRLNTINELHPILSNKGLTLERSAIQSFYNGNSTFVHLSDKTEQA